MLLQNSQLFVPLALLLGVQAAPSPQLTPLPPVFPQPQPSTTVAATQPTTLPPLSAATALVDCPLWPVANPLPALPPNSCVHVVDVVLEDGKIEIFREAAGWTNSAVELARLDAVYKAASLALPYYQPSLARPLELKLSLLRTIGGKAAKTITANGQAIPCFIDVALALDRLDAQFNTYMGNIIVHELYHCVQLHNRQGQLPPAAVLLWWFEGSAKFFEYNMYPRNIDADLDDNAPHQYKPKEPLYLQPYTSSLFFHFLRNRGWSLVRINDWIRTRKYNTDVGQERADLTADRDVAESFGAFAVAFHEKNIMFDSPLAIITTNEMQVNGPVPVSIPTVGEKYMESVRMKTWMFEKFTITLPPKQKISMTVEWTGSAIPEVEMWYRKKSATGTYSKWTKSIPYDLHTGCGKSIVTYEFIIAPVAKTESVDGHLVFTRQENGACKCKTGTPGPIKRALVSLVLDSRQMSRDNFTESSSAAQILTVGSPTLNPDSTPQTFTLSSSPSATSVPVTPGEQPIDDNPDNDEDESCSKPVGCLVGHWTIASGGMDAHLTKPFFRYSPTGFSPDTAKFSGKYTFAFSEQPNATDSTPLLFHEVLTEELQNTARTDASTPWKKLFASSTSIVDGTAAVFPSRTESGEGYEVGMLTRKVVNSTGELQIVLDDGPASFVKNNGLLYGPSGFNWDYNCSETTLFYTSRVAPLQRSYVFNRV